MEIEKNNESLSIGLDPIKWISQTLNLTIGLNSNEADCFKASRAISNLKWNLRQAFQEKQFQFEELINELVQNVTRWHRATKQMDKIDIEDFYNKLEIEINKLVNGKFLIELMEKRENLKILLTATTMEMKWKKTIKEMEKSISFNDVDRAQELLKELDNLIEEHYKHDDYHVEQCEKQRQQLINLLL